VFRILENSPSRWKVSRAGRACRAYALCASAATDAVGRSPLPLGNVIQSGARSEYAAFPRRAGRRGLRAYRFALSQAIRLYAHLAGSLNDNESRIHVVQNKPRADALCGIEKPSYVRDASVPKVKTPLRTIRAGTRCPIERRKRPEYPRKIIGNVTWK